MNQSEAPEGWEEKTLSQAVGDDPSLIVAGPFGSNLKVSDYQEQGIPIIRLQNVGDCEFLEKDMKYVSEKKARELSYHSFRGGDIAFAKLGDPIGKTCIIPEKLSNGIVVSDVVRIRVREKIANRLFLMFMLNSDICHRQLNTEIIGTTRPRVNLKQVRELKMPCPPKPEQDKIAGVLKTVQRAIVGTKELIEKQKKIKQGVSQDLLQPKADWERKPLSELIRIKHGFAFQGEFFSDEPNENILLTPGNFHVEGGLYFTPANTKYYTGRVPREFILKNGDLLVVMTDLTKEMNILGNVVLLNHNLNILHNQRIGRIIIKDNALIDKHYLLHYMNLNSVRQGIKRTATGTTVRHTSPDRILSNTICYPKSVNDQSWRSRILDSIEALMNSERAYLFKLTRIRSGLMQELLTGKVRVAA